LRYIDRPNYSSAAHSKRSNPAVMVNFASKFEVPNQNAQAVESITWRGERNIGAEGRREFPQAARATQWP
jgi:hypothetical protein